MANTVVGIFGNEADAQQAQNYLLANGYADGDVDIKTASYKTKESEETANDHDEDFFDRIGSFFKDLFGDNEGDSRLYAEAGKRGTIVTVHSLSNDEAASAAAILDRFGAIDVKENAANYGAGHSVPESEQRSSPAVADAHQDHAVDLISDEPFLNDPATESHQVIEGDRVGERTFQSDYVPSRSLIVQRQVQEGIRLRQNSEDGISDNSQSDSDFDTYRDKR